MELVIRFSELAEALKITPRCLRAWVAAGKVPQPIELSSKVRCWRVETIEDWLAQKEEAIK